MPTCLPESPTFASPAEHEVWELLRARLGDEDLLIANQWLMTEDRDLEADLVVVMPGAGVAVLEVKGGAVRYDGGWIQSGGGDEPRWIHPVDQARDAKYALRTFVEDQACWGSRTRVRWTHGVVTPYSSFPEDFALAELPRAALHDRDDLADLAGRVRRSASAGDSQRAPDTDDAWAIADALTGKLQVTGFDVNAEAADRAATADRLTDQQAMILSVTRLVNRVEVRGGAGSGKTVLALQQAKELTRGLAKGTSTERPPQRVALLCYSLGLAAYLKRVVSTWERRHRPAFVGTFHEFGRQWGAPDGDRDNSGFWEEDLPALMSGLASDLPDGKKYDAVVVDEAQDFAVSWWTPVLKALRDEERGGLYLFSDENQRIFGRFGVPPVSLVPLVLDHCLRNTHEIHGVFAPLAPSRMYARGGHGPAVGFVPATARTAIDVADEEVVRLLDEEGWEPGRVALITTGRRHWCHREQFEDLGQDRYWETFWEGEEIFYGHVLGCKGLERPAVVLCLNEGEVTDRARERLYVGMSRATDELVVVGDPAWVREVGGPAVARALGISD